jgi:hypothetical protein
VAKTRDLETRLERVEQQLRLFQRVSRLMARDLDLDDVLHEMVTLLQDFLQSDSCLIYLVEEGELVLAASSDQNRQNIGRVRLRLNEGLTGWVARERRLLAISREAYSDSRFKYFKDLPQDTFEAFLSWVSKSAVCWRYPGRIARCNPARCSGFLFQPLHCFSLALIALHIFRFALIGRLTNRPAFPSRLETGKIKTAGVAPVARGAGS